MEADLNRRMEQLHLEEVKLAIRENKVAVKEREAAAFEDVLKAR